MKKISVILCALASVLIFTGASIWEGSATVSPAGELPEGAYYQATNSFPHNTVVEVTNLENGRTVRVTVASGLDSPGLLATLSPNAADALGIQTRGSGRIRMTQSSGTPDRIFSDAAVISLEDFAPEAPASPQAVPFVSSVPAERAEPPAAVPPTPLAPITLVPAEERPPQGGPQGSILPGTIISPIQRRPAAPASVTAAAPDPRYRIGPVVPHQQSLSPAQPVPAQPPLSGGSIFSVPLVAQLEQGKSYVQVGAFTQPNTLETVVGQLNRNYPLMVQPGGSPAGGVYRLLIGPLNAGESGAVLQQIKHKGYPDAFVRN
jgi:hypothetical protein